ncbi:MAG TPA: methyltransferase domain-containing protein [Bacteroidia bacterium]|nr:methyltransferase domain-containing protein [Bacteroidia bacterium]
MLPSDYPTQREIIFLSQLSIKLDIISDVDYLFNELIKKGEEHPDVQDERIPYWADLWPSAIVLAQYLVSASVIHPKMNVLEIGCGLGLPGIVAGKLGANVALTDYLPEPLIFAKHNWDLNNSSPAVCKILDWRNPVPSFAADLVLAADVAYESSAFTDLTNAFRVLIKPGGELVMTEPNRAYAQSFFNDLKVEGFDVKTTHSNVVRHGLKTKVNIHRIKPV